MTALPDHGPGCKPIAGSHSRRFPGEPRYICTARCPRQRAMDERVVIAHHAKVTVFAESIESVVRSAIRDGITRSEINAMLREAAELVEEDCP
jgi:hypothetical protein